jgi:hypothetical protein
MITRLIIASRVHVSRDRSSKINRSPHRRCQRQSQSTWIYDPIKQSRSIADSFPSVSATKAALREKERETVGEKGTVHAKPAVSRQSGIRSVDKSSVLSWSVMADRSVSFVRSTKRHCDNRSNQAQVSLRFVSFALSPRQPMTYSHALPPWDCS